LRLIDEHSYCNRVLTNHGIQNINFELQIITQMNPPNSPNEGLHQDHVEYYGLPFDETFKNISLSGYTTIKDDYLMFIQDVRVDNPFYDISLVSEVKAKSYSNISSFNNREIKCECNQKSQKLSYNQVEQLSAVDKYNDMLSEQRVENHELKILKEQLQLKNSNLEKFAQLVSHDLKSPLNNILALTDLIKSEDESLNEETKKYLSLIKESSESLREYIDNILKFYKGDDLIILEKEEFSFDNLITECLKVIGYTNNKDIDIKMHSEINVIKANKMVLKQIFINLITNAIKYNDKEKISINLICNANDSHYIFSVEDNGIGIPPEEFDNLFDLFEKRTVKDRFGNYGNGIGLASIQKLLKRLNGFINLESQVNVGTKFIFGIEKN